MTAYRDERSAVELARLLVVGVDAAIRVLLAGRMWVKHRVRKG